VVQSATQIIIAANPRKTISAMIRCMRPPPELNEAESNCYQIATKLHTTKIKRDRIEGAGRGAMSARFSDAITCGRVRSDEDLRISRPVPQITRPPFQAHKMRQTSKLQLPVKTFC